MRAACRRRAPPRLSLAVASCEVRRRRWAAGSGLRLRIELARSRSMHLRAKSCRGRAALGAACGPGARREPDRRPVISATVDRRLRLLGQQRRAPARRRHRAAARRITSTRTRGSTIVWFTIVLEASRSLGTISRRPSSRARSVGQAHVLDVPVSPSKVTRSPMRIGWVIASRIPATPFASVWRAAKPTTRPSTADEARIAGGHALDRRELRQRQRDPDHDDRRRRRAAARAAGGCRPGRQLAPPVTERGQLRRARDRHGPPAGPARRDTTVATAVISFA